MNYTLRTKVDYEKAHKVPLKGIDQEEALRQFEATKTSLLLTGKRSLVQLFDEQGVLQKEEMILE